MPQNDSQTHPILKLYPSPGNVGSLAAKKWQIPGENGSIWTGRTVFLRGGALIIMPISTLSRTANDSTRLSWPRPQSIAVARRARRAVEGFPVNSITRVMLKMCPFLSCYLRLIYAQTSPKPRISLPGGDFLRSYMSLPSFSYFLGKASFYI